jgi:hypothetical protein
VLFKFLHFAASSIVSGLAANKGFSLQLSGQFMLLQHHGLKSADAVSLSAAIAVNYSLTHLDLCDNRCVLLSVSMHRNFGARAARAHVEGGPNDVDVMDLHTAAWWTRALKR